VLELGLVWMLFFPRRWRIVCVFIVTPWEIGVILTANYTFLNYLVLALGFLLLDDRFLLPFLPRRWNTSLHARKTATTDNELALPPSSAPPNDPGEPKEGTHQPAQVESAFGWRLRILKLSLANVLLIWIFYATMAGLIWMFSTFPLPTTPVALLEPFRIANRYGLFGVMTRGRYEIEFQGSDDGASWVAYPFRFKPQGLNKAPGIYAPYQPRFDWNLWFASLGSWQEYPIVPRTEVKLLENDSDVVSLFKSSPFPNRPPREIRAVLWQYWFTSMAEKRATGLWWRREFIGLYAPTLKRDADGSIRAVEMPTSGPRE
jgi:lipase maturation factor 1